jgi:hypothetical protein
MPAKKGDAGVSAAEIEQRLPKTFFVMRGHIAAAFGFTKEELSVLIADGVFVPKYPFGGAPCVEKRGKKTIVRGERARFVRSQVLAVARKWEAN